MTAITMTGAEAEAADLCGRWRPHEGLTPLYGPRASDLFQAGGVII